MHLEAFLVGPTRRRASKTRRVDLVDAWPSRRRSDSPRTSLTVPSACTEQESAALVRQRANARGDDRVALSRAEGEHPLTLATQRPLAGASLRWPGGSSQADTGASRQEARGRRQGRPRGRHQSPRPPRLRDPRHHRVRHRAQRLGGEVAARGPAPRSPRATPASTTANCGCSRCTSRRGSTPSALAATTPTADASSSCTATSSRAGSTRSRPSRSRSCPLKLYFKDGEAKVELALAKGKKQQDRRQALAKRDAEREMARAARHAEKYGG